MILRRHDAPECAPLQAELAKYGYELVKQLVDMMIMESEMLKTHRHSEFLRKLLLKHKVIKSSTKFIYVNFSQYHYQAFNPETRLVEPDKKGRAYMLRISNGNNHVKVKIKFYESEIAQVSQILQQAS